MNAIKKMGMALGVIGLIFVMSACGSSMRIQQGNEEFSIDADKYYEALAMQDDEEYFDAIRAWAAVLNDEPRFAIGHFNLGLIYDHLNMVPEAIESYEVAVRRAEDSQAGNEALGLYQMHLGAVYLRANLVDEALIALTASLKHDPYEPMVHYNLSAAYITRGNYDDALIHADAAVDLLSQPDSRRDSKLAEGVDRGRLSQYLLRQAECHLARKEWAKARVALERVEKQCHATVPASMWAKFEGEPKAEGNGGGE